MFEGFNQKRMAGQGATLNVLTGGTAANGLPPVLMIHGYPQTHVVWRHLAPRLAETRPGRLPRPARLRR